MLVEYLPIVLLFVVNRPILDFNCPKCGKNVFFRGRFAVFWPNRICTRCGRDLDVPPSQNR